MNRSDFVVDAEVRSQKNLRFPMGIKTERQSYAEYNEENWPSIGLSSKDDKMMRMMEKVLDGQNAILRSLRKLESEVDEIKKNICDIHKNNEELKFVQYSASRQLEKVNAELFKIGNRTGCIKDLAVSTAAHTLNTARKIHGAKSVLEPVKQFKEGGYLDWVIRPETSVQAKPNAPVLQFQLKNENIEESNPYQLGNKTPAYTPRTPCYQGNKTTAYVGSRTPQYDRSDKEDLWNAERNDQYSSYKNKTMDFSSVGVFGARYQPYQKHQYLNSTFPVPKCPSPYEPTSPTFD